MKLSIPVVETIQKRHSVRTYESKPLLPPRSRSSAYVHEAAG